MPSPDPGSAATARPFADVLGEINHGVVADQAALALQEVVQRVRSTGRKGKVVLSIEVAAGKGNERNLTVAASVTSTLPKDEAPACLFFFTDDGGLTRDDPEAAGALFGVERGGAVRHP